MINNPNDEDDSYYIYTWEITQARIRWSVDSMGERESS